MMIVYQGTIWYDMTWHDMMYYATLCYSCQWYWAIIFFTSLLHSYQHGRTPILAALNHNYIDVIRYLIEAGADVNQKDGVSIRIPYTAMCECMFCLSIILYHMWIQSFDHIMLIHILSYYVIVFRIQWCHYHQFLHNYYCYFRLLLNDSH